MCSKDLRRFAARPDDVAVVVPAAGADSYRIFVGDQANLAAGENGGSLLTTTPVNTVEVAGGPAMGGFDFYLVAGVRDGIQGSLGQDSLGTERLPAAP